MPEITAALIAFIAGSVAAGAIIGWFTRSKRCAQEKVAVNEGWQRQLEAQRSEHSRLLDQNRSLMEQISQLQASGKDATNRARELSDALKEAFERRDQLQRQLKEIRSGLDQSVQERDELRSALESIQARDDTQRTALQDKDDKIERLSRELENWQDRLPPLIERYRVRDGEARQLEEELAAARARIESLEQPADPGETRIEPVDQESLGDELDASNDPANVTYTGIKEVLDDPEIEPPLRDEAHAGEPGGNEVAVDGGRPDDTENLDEDVVDTVERDDDEDNDTERGGDEVEVNEGWPEDIGDTDEDNVAEPDVDTEIAAAGDVTEIHDGEPGGLRDNLRLIKGIGPAIEKTLNELGIFRYHQIAEMTEYDIDRVAQRLKGFSSRIYREDWIGQARDLQLKKAGT